MSKHTPGPWTVRRSMPEDGYDCWFISACPLPNREVDIGDVAGGYPHEQKEANARLIAAAPELLAALSAMLTHMGMDEDEWNKPTYDQARAAIAKATGEAA
mgnify:CR=1 FL=1